MWPAAKHLIRIKPPPIDLPSVPFWWSQSQECTTIAHQPPSCGESLRPPFSQHLPTRRRPLVDRHRKLGSSENKTRRNEHPEKSHAKYRDHGEDQDGLKNLLPSTRNAAPCCRSVVRQCSGAGGSVHRNGRRIRLNWAKGECGTAAGWNEKKGSVSAGPTSRLRYRSGLFKVNQMPVTWSTDG